MRDLAIAFRLSPWHWPTGDPVNTARDKTYFRILKIPAVGSSQCRPALYTRPTFTRVEVKGIVHRPTRSCGQIGKPISLRACPKGLNIELK